MFINHNNQSICKGYVTILPAIIGLHYTNNCSTVSDDFEYFFQFIFEVIFKFPITAFISTHYESDKKSGESCSSIMIEFWMAPVGNWSTNLTSWLYYNKSFSGTVSLLLGFEVFCLYWSKPKRLCHHFTVLTPKIRTSPNYSPKSLLNVLNLLCYTNCLQCFSHFHMLTHSLKISYNPSLVAWFFLKAQRN